MKIKKNQVLSTLAKHTDSLSIKQLRQMLGLNKRYHFQVKDLLHELVLAGKVAKRGTRFSIAEISQHKPHAVRHNQITHPPHHQSNASPKAHNSEKIKGIYTTTSKGYGFVIIGNGQEDLFIPPHKEGGAMDGDEVLVELIHAHGRGKSRGQVVKITKRHCLRVIARLVRHQNKILALPLNLKSGLPPVQIIANPEYPDIPLDSFVEVEIIDVQQPKHKASKKAEYFGKIVSVMSGQSLEQIALNTLLAENNIRTTFTEETLFCANQLPKRVVYDPASKRVDLRSCHFVTIDGKTARDFDDAVYVQAQDSGGYQLFVSIADVAHYVQKDDLVDQEAYQRGTSVYLPTHAISMLPEVLSNNLCSLKPGVNRLTLTCQMTLSAEGEVDNYSVYESIIRSHGRLVYEDVEDFYQEKATPIRNEEMREQLLLMKKLADILIRKRSKRGAIDFDFPDFEIELDEHDKMWNLKKRYQSSAMRVIEQFMLEANETIASHCKLHKIPMLFRNHLGPDQIKLMSLQKTFWFHGIKVDLSSIESSREFNEIFVKIKDLPNRNQLQLMLLRCMSLAVYSPYNKGHYGLAAPNYCHFTSPIRRYPDLLLHRALKTHIRETLENKGKPKNSVPESIGDFLSQQERRAETVEKKSTKLKIVAFMENKLDEIFDAQVISVENSGFSVELKKYSIEWFIPLEMIDEDLYIYDKVSLSLRGRYKHRVIRSGVPLKLKLLRTDLFQQQMDFHVESWEQLPKAVPSIPSKE
ncbi:VacB/RNase II family 3'-5' exoribonuclease [Deltaproteobacteria bacterium TL4]